MRNQANVQFAMLPKDTRSDNLVVKAAAREGAPLVLFVSEIIVRQLQ